MNLRTDNNIQLSSAAVPAINNTNLPAVKSFDPPAIKSRKKTRTISRRGRRALIIFIITAAVASAMMAASIVYSGLPVALSLDGETLCYLDTKSDADEALKIVAADYTPEDDELKAVNLSAPITASKVLKGNVDLKTADEAAKLIESEILEQNKATITTETINVATKKFTPEVEYRKDDKMLAGQSRIEDEGTKGKKKVTSLVTTANGEVINKDVLETEILKEGSPKIIYKGTVGLPDGEDWKTYDGPPEFKDGEEMIEFAKNYLGLRYVYGGNSLETGVDCVTFVINIYKKFGVNIPHTYNGIKKGGIAVTMDQAKAGDVIVYNGHVAMYMGNGKIIHATRGKSWNVHISNVNYSKKRHIQTIRRFVSP